MNNVTHIPVMLETSLKLLQLKSDAWYVDATFGRGGHTRAMLEQGAKVIAFDWDAEAIEYGQAEFAAELAAGQLILIPEDFSQLERALARLPDTVGPIEGILFDFGTSTQQLKSQERGFSFEGTGPLDMRMDQRQGVQAKDLLAVLSEKQLAQVFADYGGEEHAKRIAKAIKSSPTPVTTTDQLRDLIEKIKPHQGQLHPATKVFQALRIVVNSELENIKQALPQALNLLKRGGRIVTIAFHEGEDRLVKEQFRSWADQQLGTTNREVMKPTVAEHQHNPRARSAKVRYFEKH